MKTEKCCYGNIKQNVTNFYTKFIQQTFAFRFRSHDVVEFLDNVVTFRNKDVYIQRQS